MTKIESLKQLLEYQFDKCYDIELRYKHTELNSSEVRELMSIVCNLKQYYYPQTISVDGSSYNRLILAQRQKNDDEYPELNGQDVRELLSIYEKKVEAEEDKRDKKERIKKEKETERKKVLSQEKKELDEIFYNHWIEKIKALKDLIPQTENHFKGKGRGKKYKAYFRKQTTLFFEAQEFYVRRR